MIVSAPVSLTGTSALLSNIPAGTKQLIVNVVGVTFSGTEGLRLQLGTSAGIVTTGYESWWQFLTVTQYTQGSVVGFDETPSNLTSKNYQMRLMLADPTNNLWVGAFQGASRPSGYNWNLYGRVPLPGVLDRVQVSVVSSFSFTAGKANYVAN